MLNLKFIQDNPELVIEKLKKKNFDASGILGEIVDLYKQKNKLQKQADDARAAVAMHRFHRFNELGYLGFHGFGNQHRLHGFFNLALPAVNRIHGPDNIYASRQPGRNQFSPDPCGLVFAGGGHIYPIGFHVVSPQALPNFRHAVDV